jgi:hypothetical protein
MRFSNCIPSRHICRLSGASDYIASNCPASVTRNACGRIAVLHALSQYSNAVPDRGKIDEGELHQEARIDLTG